MLVRYHLAPLSRTHRARGGRARRRPQCARPDGSLCARVTLWVGRCHMAAFRSLLSAPCVGFALRTVGSHWAPPHMRAISGGRVWVPTV